MNVWTYSFISQDEPGDTAVHNGLYLFPVFFLGYKPILVFLVHSVASLGVSTILCGE